MPTNANRYKAKNVTIYIKRVLLCDRTILFFIQRFQRPHELDKGLPSSGYSQQIPSDTHADVRVYIIRRWRYLL
jgi:hypothetical protein